MIYLHPLLHPCRWAGLPLIASLVLVAGLSILPAQAQDQPVNCTTALTDAERSYNLGEFDRVITLLDTCVERNAFQQNQLRQVYRLMGLSYIGKQLEADARAAVTELLSLVPDYEPHPVNDPPTFARMVSEVKAEQQITQMQDDPEPTTTTPPSSPPETSKKRWLLIGAGAVVVGVLAAVLAGGGGGGGGLPGPPPLPGGN